MRLHLAGTSTAIAGCFATATTPVSVESVIDLLTATESQLAVAQAVLESTVIELGIELKEAISSPYRTDADVANRGKGDTDVERTFVCSMCGTSKGSSSFKRRQLKMKAPTCIDCVTKPSENKRSERDTFEDDTLRQSAAPPTNSYVRFPSQRGCAQIMKSHDHFDGPQMSLLHDELTFEVMGIPCRLVHFPSFRAHSVNFAFRIVHYFLSLKHGSIPFTDHPRWRHGRKGNMEEVLRDQQ
jgi:hypothetical protein